MCVDLARIVKPQVFHCSHWMTLIDFSLVLNRNSIHASLYLEASARQLVLLLMNDVNYIVPATHTAMWERDNMDYILPKHNNGYSGRVAQCHLRRHLTLKPFCMVYIKSKVLRQNLNNVL